MNSTKAKEIKVTHIMSDGTKRDSVKGFVIPYNEDTKAFYEYISKRRTSYDSNRSDSDTNSTPRTI